MPILLFRQPVFSVAQFLLRPLLPYMGLAVANLPIYNAIFLFAQYTVRELGVIQTIQTLWNCRGYLVNRITLGVLGSILHAASPNLGIFFDDHIKDYLIRITRSGNKKPYIFIFNLLISLTLTLPFRLFIKFLIRKVILASIMASISLITGTLSIFWIEPLRNIKAALQLAWDIKSIIERYIPFTIPVPEGVKNLRDLSLFNKLFYLVSLSVTSFLAYYLPTVIYDACRLYLDIFPFNWDFRFTWVDSIFPYRETTYIVGYPFKFVFFKLIIPSGVYLWNFKYSKLFNYFKQQPSLIPETYVFKYSDPIRGYASPGSNGVGPVPDEYGTDTASQAVLNISKAEIVTTTPLQDILRSFLNYLFQTMNIFI